MTPTPSHVATDELIETLERLEKEATPGPWKLFHDDDAPAVDYIERDMGDDRRAQGLEDPILHACLPREGDLPLIVSLRNHLPALISALKENQRMREDVKVAQYQAWETAIRCASNTSRSVSERHQGKLAPIWRGNGIACAASCSCAMPRHSRPPTPGREVMGRCDECRFWCDFSKTSAIKFQSGVKECRRRAPVGAVHYGVVHDGEVRTCVVSAWAVTHADDGCGEYQPQGDAKP